MATMFWVTYGAGMRHLRFIRLIPKSDLAEKQPKYIYGLFKTSAYKEIYDILKS